MSEKTPGHLKALWITRDESFTVHVKGHTPVSRGSKIGISIERADYNESSVDIYKAAGATLNYLFELERSDFLNPTSIIHVQEMIDSGVEKIVGQENTVSRTYQGTSIDRIELDDGTVLTGKYADQWLSSKGIIAGNNPESRNDISVVDNGPLPAGSDPVIVEEE